MDRTLSVTGYLFCIRKYLTNHFFFLSLNAIKNININIDK